MEMAFAKQNDLLTTLEEVLVPVFEKFGKYKRISAAPFRHIPFNEAMERYGSDKPDLRIDLEVQDITEAVSGSEFGPFQNAVVKAVAVDNFAEGRKWIDKLLNDVEVQTGNKACWFKVDENGELTGGVSKFLQEQKEALMQLRDEMLPNMQNVTRDHLRSGASNVSSSSGQHIGDAGSEAEVRDLTIRLLGKDREQLFEIDEALERIRRGFYGICEISLDPIPKKRLQARPFCRLTVKCQEEFEKKYGSYANYKASNSDHVGFSGLQNDMENVFSLDESEE
jgi:RNA polymerase-binding transcription factor DksA